MMRSLYAEDPAASTVNQALFPQTVRTLVAHPERGRIVLFAEGETIHGYCIVMPFWSNEFGGTLAFIDELFVRPESRGQGLATRFLESIKHERPFDAVAVSLEVSAKNHRARKLYGAMGFTPRTNATMTCRIVPQVVTG